MLLWNRSESFDIKHFVGFSWNVRSDRTGQAEVSKPDTSAGASDQRVVFSQVRLSTVLEKRVPVWMYADCMECQQICVKLKQCFGGSSPLNVLLSCAISCAQVRVQQAHLCHRRCSLLSSTSNLDTYRLFLDYIRLTGGVVCLVLPWKGRRKCSRQAGGGARQLWISWRVARRVEGFGSN